MRNLYWRIGRKLYLKGRKDDIRGIVDDSEKQLLKNLQPIFAKKNNPCFFDIGANIGDWSLYMFDLYKADQGKLSQYLFEPVSKTYNQLVSNVNHIGAIVENIALSNESGEVKMFVSKEDFAGTNSIYDTGFSNTQEQTVRTIKLDDYVQMKGIEYLDFIKCDAEGHDYKIIQGSRKSFEREIISFFQFEYNQSWIYSRTYLKDVFELLEGMNYQVAKITRNGLEVYTEWHFELEKYFQSNFLIVHNDLIPEIKQIRSGRIGKGNVFVTS